MKIILNQDPNSSFILKIRYGYTDWIVKESKDKYGRFITTKWRNRTTYVKIYKVNEFLSGGVGCAECNYRDNFNKKIGKYIALKNCLDVMLSKGDISMKEYNLLKKANLNCKVEYICDDE